MHSWNCDNCFASNQRPDFFSLAFIPSLLSYYQAGARPRVRHTNNMAPRTATNVGAFSHSLHLNRSGSLQLHSTFLTRRLFSKTLPPGLISDRVSFIQV